MIRKIFFLFFAFMTSIAVADGANKQFTLVIDAGHGGHDTGAPGAFSKEKNINLNIALAFGRYVERNCPDVRVIYTRKTDVFITLKERANIANRNNADLFISVHTNALPAGRIARGFETYTLGMHRAKDNLDVAMRENSVISMEKDYKQRYQGFDPRSSESYIMFEFMQSANMEKSVELAKIIQRTVCSTAGRVDKGVHQAGFLVLRETSMPSCLIELGFISTPDEENFLNSEQGIDAMARGIYQAFVTYKNRYSGKVVVPYVAPKSNSFEDQHHIFPQDDTPSSSKERNASKKEREQEKMESKVETVKHVVHEVKEEQVKPEPLMSTVQPLPNAPVFKVQIFVSDSPLPAKHPQFKGHGKDVESYSEGGMTKYTIGSSGSYDEICRIHNSLKSDFPGSFVIALKNGKRMDLHQAIKESKKH